MKDGGGGELAGIRLFDSSAERALIGAVFLRPELVQTCDVDELDFFDPKHRTLWQAIGVVQKTHGAVDTALIEAELVRQGKLESIGGFTALCDLALASPSADNAVFYVKELKRKRMVRDVVQGIAGTREALRKGLDGEELLSEVQTLFAKISQPTKERSANMATLRKRAALEIWEVLKAKERGEDVSIKLPSGIPSVDRLIGGFPRGLVSVVSGRPATGKSTFSQAVATHCARLGIPSVIVTYEDDGTLYAIRSIAADSGLTVTQLSEGNITTRGDFDRFTKALDNPNGIERLHVFKGHGLDPVRACKMAATLVEGMGLVVLDYVQNAVRLRERVGRHEIIQEFMVGAQAIAAEHRLALLVVSQLSREQEKRGDSPRMGDLKGSGALEEDAKLILALDGVRDQDGEPIEGKVRVSVLKNTLGQAHQDTVLRFDGARARFSDDHPNAPGSP